MSFIACESYTEDVKDYETIMVHDIYIDCVSLSSSLRFKKWSTTTYTKPQSWNGGTWGFEERILAGLDYTNVD